MSNLTVFGFESEDVRVLSINGEPWFVARDILKAIRSATTVSAVETLIREELGEEFVTNQPLLTKGGTQSLLLLSEPATSLVIARSRTEWGKRMNRWIHVEVLPSIRKTGNYFIGSSNVDLTSEIDLAGYALDVAFSGVGLNPGLLAGLKLNAFSAVHPQLRGYLNEGHKLIAATNTIEGELLSPTAIGKKMGISARQVNAQLIEAGLQEENPNYGKYGHKREPRYLPTDRGREFCEVTLATGRNTSTSFQQIKWYESVIEAIA